MAAAGPATLPAGDAGSTSTDVGGGATVGTATRSTDSGTGSTGPGAVWTDSDAAATGWTGVVFASTGEMAPRSIGSRVPALSPTRELGADSAASATSLAMRSAWGGVPAAAAGPIGDIASRDSVAAGIGTWACGAAPTPRRRRTRPRPVRSPLRPATRHGEPACPPGAGRPSPARPHPVTCPRSKARSRSAATRCPRFDYGVGAAVAQRVRSPVGGADRPSSADRRSRPRRSGRGDATSRRALKVRGLPAFTTNT